MTVLMSTSLKVVSIAAVCCASTSLSEILARSLVMGTRCSSRWPAGNAGALVVRWGLGVLPVPGKLSVLAELSAGGEPSVLGERSVLGVLSALYALGATRAPGTSCASAGTSCFRPPPASEPRPIWSSTSDLVIRPPRPVPLIAFESTRCSRINRRTAGPARSSFSLSKADGDDSRTGAASGAAASLTSEASEPSAAASPSFLSEAPDASPGSNSANTSPAVTVAPSATRTSCKMPSLGEGTSSTTLSVSSSTSFSSLRTGSPGERCQFTNVASLTDSGSCGTLISIVTFQSSHKFH